MFTIKQEQACGESIHQGRDIVYERDKGEVRFFNEYDVRQSLDVGIIWVMNAAGKTVAKYALAPANES